MSTSSPATTRRRLRVELRRLREDAGLNQADVVRKLDWSQSKLIRIENGSVGVSVTDARALLSLYGAPSELSDDLVSLARRTRTRTWWSRYRDVLNPAYQEFIGYEADASRLRHCHPTIVPGLLQTELYARTLIPALALAPRAQSTYDSLIEVRLKRQAEILHGDNPPEYIAIIDEGALRRPVGGPDIMRAQLRHLVDLQDLKHATVAVLPFSAGPHVGMQGAFHIMDFADAVDEPVFFTETAQGNMVLRDNPEVIAQYGKAFDRMLEMSLRSSAAADFLRRLADEIS
jgi:transcriptional regulator with XRE-family HTH domain